MTALTLINCYLNVPIIHDHLISSVTALYQKLSVPSSEKECSNLCYIILITVSFQLYD